MNPVINWLIRLWIIPDNIYNPPDIIVPLGYGLVSPGLLSSATREAINESVDVQRQFSSAIIFCASNDYFWKGSKGQEDELKKKYFKGKGVDNYVLIPKGISNSVDEAREILKFIKSLNLSAILNIVIVADKLHARSTELIWKKMAEKYLPETVTVFFVKSIDGRWPKDHPSWFQRSKTRWFLANVLRHILFIVLGERIAKIHYPIKKEAA